MQDPGSHDDIQGRLKDFSRRLAEYRAKLESPDHELGQHMGHLVEYERAHEDLSKCLAQADLSTWEQIAQTFEDDLDGLTDRFDKWAAYVDEEYKQTR